MGKNQNINKKFYFKGDRQRPQIVDASHSDLPQRVTVAAFHGETICNDALDGHFIVHGNFKVTNIAVDVT